MIKIKQGWDEVTIAEFFHINSILKDDGLNDLEKKIAILAVLGSCDESEFDNYQLSDVHELFRQSDFIYQEPKGNIQDYYFIGGKRYKFVKDVNKLTAAQFIDLTSYTKTAEDIIENLHLICTTLLLPAPFEPAKPIDWKRRMLNKVIRRIKQPKAKVYMASKGVREFTSEITNLPVETYLQTPQEETAENLFTNMKVSDAMGIALFFCLLFDSFLKTTEAYLGLEMKNQLKLILPMLKTPEQKEMMMKIMEKSETGFKQNGDGLPQSTALLKVTD